MRSPLTRERYLDAVANYLLNTQYNQTEVSPMQSFVTFISVLSQEGRRKRTLLTFLLAAFFLISLNVIPVHAVDDYIIVSGTVSLPTGVAPAGGENVEVWLNFDGGGTSMPQFVTIAQGQSSAAYTFTMVLGPNITSLTAMYKYKGLEAYLAEGYYNEVATTFDSSQATVLSATTSHANINLTLLAGNRFSGTVNLPSQKVAPTGGIDIAIIIWDVVGGGYDYRYVNIAEGTSSATYQLIMPIMTDAQWVVYYQYWGNEYINLGFYNLTATTPEVNQATLLAGAVDHEGLNMTLLKKFNWNLFLPAITCPKM